MIHLFKKNSILVSHYFVRHFPCKGGVEGFYIKLQNSMPADPKVMLNIENL
jgi:hypothetical protein